MSLITRCPSCGTNFKVVTDQLKVSQGWVRCGQCAKVFDASQTLQEVAPSQLVVSEARPAQQHLAQASQAAVMSGMRQAIDSVANAYVSADSSPVLPIEEVVMDSQPEPEPLPQPDPAPAPSPQPAPSHIHPPQHSAVDLLIEPTPVTAPMQPNEPVIPGSDEPEVSFVREARKKALWRRPLMRVTLVLVALLLTTGLLLQVAVFQRNELATTQPALKPWLERLCTFMRCEIKPLQRIDAVVIDSSTFTKVSNELYQLNVVIKNTSTTPLATPSLELTLTDVQDQIVVRRVLAPAQFGAGDTLSASTEFTGGLGVKVVGTAALGHVVGYRLFVFYP